MFLKIVTRGFRPFGKSQDTKEISASYDYAIFKYEEKKVTKICTIY